MIYERGELTIQKYSNGSYAFFSAESKGWKNINKELAEAIIKYYKRS